MKLYPHDLDAGADVAVSVAEPVSVIGFPFGHSPGGRLAVWATGFVATDLDVQWNSLPAMLVDCRARPGQSGSPVVARRSGPYTNNNQALVFGGTVTRFIGVYSGRINDQSDLGIVWNATAVKELIASL